MEEKKANIAKYLKTVVSPFVTPLMEELVNKRPQDILIYTQNYVQNLIDQRDKNKKGGESSEEEKEDDEADRKFKEQLLKKKGGKKVDRQGISAEAYGAFNKKQEFVPQVVPKDGKTKETIKALLKKSVLFNKLADEDMNIVLDAITVEEKAQDSFVIKEGEQGDVLYIVGSGQYACTKIIKGTQTFLKTYVKGESFGELALMYNAPRAATIQCSSSGIVYGLDRQTFKHIVEEAANRRRTKFNEILSKVSILSEVDPYEKQSLCDILIEENFAAGEEIVREGEEGDKFYMIAEGDLIAEKAGKKVYEFKTGDYFGEIALIRDAPRQATVKCLTKAKVLSIERSAFKRMFGPIEEILKRNEDKYKQFICD